MEPGTFVATLERLWSRSQLLLWALATACIVAFIALAVAAHFDPTTFGATAQSANAWLLLFGAALLVLAGFRTSYEKRQRGLRIVPHEQQFFWGTPKYGDGRIAIQIAGHFEVYNLSDQPIVLAEVRPIKPHITGEFMDRSVHLRDPRSEYVGDYAIPPRSRGEGSFHMFAFQDFSSQGPQMDIVVKVADQFGRWYRIKLPRVRRAGTV